LVGGGGGVATSAGAGWEGGGGGGGRLEFDLMRLIGFFLTDEGRDGGRAQARL